MLKSELHLCRRFWLGIFGAEHSDLSVPAARLTIQCKCDRIEYSGLSCPGISRNQIKPLCTQFIEIYLFSSCIWSKRRHDKLFRSHISHPTLSLSAMKHIPSVHPSCSGCSATRRILQKAAAEISHPPLHLPLWSVQFWYAYCHIRAA